MCRRRGRGTPTDQGREAGLLSRERTRSGPRASRPAPVARPGEVRCPLPGFTWNRVVLSSELRSGGAAPKSAPGGGQCPRALGSWERRPAGQCSLVDRRERKFLARVDRAARCGARRARTPTGHRERAGSSFSPGSLMSTREAMARGRGMLKHDSHGVIATRREKRRHCTLKSDARRRSRTSCPLRC